MSIASQLSGPYGDYIKRVVLDELNIKEWHEDPELMKKIEALALPLMTTKMQERGKGDVIVEWFEDGVLNRYAVAIEHDLIVALDCVLTPELIEEGNAREFVHKIQGVRKEQALEYTDQIVLRVESNELDINEMLEHYTQYIKGECQVKEMMLGGYFPDAEGVVVNVDDRDIKVNVELV